MSADESVLQQHVTRLMVLKRDLGKAKAAYDTASKRAYADFALARNRGIPQIKGRLPGGDEAGLFVLLAGGTDTKVNEDLLLSIIAAGSPGDLEDYVLPAALEDDRVIKLLKDHLHELVQVRISKTAREALDKQVEETGGFIADPVTGEPEKVAEVTRLNATGTFRFIPGKRFEQQIRDAIDAGQITGDGTIAEAEPSPLPAGADPAEHFHDAAPFRDEDGFLSPEKAALHAAIVQGGYTTPPIEAYRMIHDGGIAAERARAWLIERGLDPADPHRGEQTPWPLPVTGNLTSKENENGQ